MFYAVRNASEWTDMCFRKTDFIDFYVSMNKEWPFNVTKIH